MNTLAPLTQQLNNLEKVFGNLSYPSLVPGDNLVPLPTFEFLGKHFKLTDPYGKDYYTLVSKLWELVPFKENYVKQYYKKSDIRLHERTKKQLQKIETRFDVLVFPADLGIKYQGKSVDEVETLIGDETLMVDLVHFLCIAIGSPELIKTLDPFLDIPGTELRYGRDWDGRPICRQDGQSAGLGVYWSSHAGGRFGSLLAALGDTGTRPLNPRPLESLSFDLSEIVVNGVRYRRVEE